MTGFERPLFGAEYDGSTDGLNPRPYADIPQTGIYREIRISHFEKVWFFVPSARAPTAPCVNRALGLGLSGLVACTLAGAVATTPWRTLFAHPPKTTDP